MLTGPAADQSGDMTGQLPAVQQQRGKRLVGHGQQQLRLADQYELQLPDLLQQHQQLAMQQRAPPQPPSLLPLPQPALPPPTSPSHDEQAKLQAVKAGSARQLQSRRQGKHRTGQVTISRSLRCSCPA